MLPVEIHSCDVPGFDVPPDPVPSNALFDAVVKHGRDDKTSHGNGHHDGPGEVTNGRKGSPRRTHAAKHDAKPDPGKAIAEGFEAAQATVQPFNLACQRAFVLRFLC